MSFHPIDEQIEHFNHLASDAKVSLTNMLHALSTGYLPCAQDLRTFEHQLTDLHHQREAVASLASLSLDEEQLPQDDCSIYDYQRAMHQTQRPNAPQLPAEIMRLLAAL